MNSILGRLPKRASFVALSIAALAASACSGRSTVTPPIATNPALLAPSATGSSAAHFKKPKTGQIQHVVVIIQENRSFDNLFQAYPGANTQSYGLAVPTPAGGGTPVPGTTPVSIPLQQIALDTHFDIYHDHFTWLLAWDKGNMDGFNQEPTVPAQSGFTAPMYSYVPEKDVKPYWTMAQEYVLADDMFASHIDGSFVAHQYLIAGQANREVDYPSLGSGVGGPWGCVGGPTDTIHQLLPNPNPSHLQDPASPVPVCEDPQTLGDELDTAKLPWKLYSYVDISPSGNEPEASNWEPYQAVSHIYYGPDYANIISPPTQILTDIAAGNLPAVTWVNPLYPDSDHPGGGGAKKGPSWVASVVNAIGKNKTLWNTTAIFVVWDDWGGFYDHVSPPQVDFDGLGFRVPLLCIGPYAQQGVVNHTQLEFGSILRMIENNWNLPQLAPSDTRATPADQGCMDYSQAPRKFKKLPALYPPSYFIQEKPDHTPVDTQ